MHLTNKWGSMIVLTFIVGTLAATVLSGINGFSSWLGDSYIPKKYIILEKYPVRVIIYGQFGDNKRDKDSNCTDTERCNNRAVLNIISLIRALDSVQYAKGSFGNDINVNFDSNFNSKQIRATNRTTAINGNRGE